MKVLVLLATLLAGSQAAPADTCDASFGGFLNSLKDQIEKQGRPLENEWRDDYAKQVRQCFATSADDSKCVLTDAELNGDVYGDTGPLQGCSRCQSVVQGFRAKFMGSQESVRKCFRQKLAEAIREELEPCIQAKISNGYSFKVPPIPDFDEKAFSNVDIIEKGINCRIMARSRMDACNNANRAKYQVTAPCMDKGIPGNYPLHCQCIKDARGKGVPSSCNGRFEEVKKATCQCMDEKRDEWHKRFAKVQDIVTSTTEGSIKSAECGTGVSAELGTWLAKIQDAVDACWPKDPNAPAGQKMNLRALIDIGCGQLASGGIKKNELTTGFRFMRLFLDALNDRLTAYCDKTC